MSEYSRLVAAAPELLRVLRDLVERVDNTPIEDGSNIDTLAAHMLMAQIEGKNVDIAKARDLFKRIQALVENPHWTADRRWTIGELAGQGLSALAPEEKRRRTDLSDEDIEGIAGGPREE